MHPANGQPFLHVKSCGSCLHYDAQLSRCMGSKGYPTTWPAQMACIRFLPLGRLGKALAEVQAHPRTCLLLAAAVVGSQLLVGALRIL